MVRFPPPVFPVIRDLVRSAGPRVECRLVHDVQHAGPVDHTAAVTNQPDCAKVPHVLVDVLPLLNIVVLLRLIVLFVILLVRSCPPVVSFDELRQIAGLLCPSDKRMLEKFSCRWPFLGVTLQAQLDELLEPLAEVSLQAWRRILGNQE